MPVIWTRYGRDAHFAPRKVVSDAKQTDPLAPVTALVPADLCGVIVRRTLRAGVAGQAGVAGLSVIKADWLAERMAAPSLVGSGRRPTIGLVLAVAW